MTGVSATTKYHLEYYMQRGLRCEMKYKLYTMSSSNLFVLHQQSTAYVDIHLDLLQYPSSSVCMKKSDMMDIFQVWPLTHFFLLPFCKELLICLEGKSITFLWANTFLFCSSHQLASLSLGPLGGFLPTQNLQGPATCLKCCLGNKRDARTPPGMACKTLLEQPWTAL